VVFTEKKPTEVYKLALIEKHKLAFWIRQTCATPQLILKVLLKCWVRRQGALSYLISRCLLGNVPLTCIWEMS